MAAVILHFRDLDATRECISSVLQADQPPARVIVVNNDADHKLTESISTEFPSVEVPTPDENLGFGGGMNLGIQAVADDGQIEFVWCLNNDLEVAPDCLRHLLDAMQRDHGLGGVCPSVYDCNGELYSIGARVIALLGLWLPRRDGDAATKVPTRMLDGSSMLFRKRVLLDVEGFDENFFANIEDVDLCMRVRDVGYELAAVPRGRVVHEGSGSKAGHFSTSNIYLSSRNWVYLLRKRWPRPAVLAASPIYLLARTALVLIWSVHTRRADLFRPHIAGVLSGFFEDPGNFATKSLEQLET